MVDDVYIYIADLPRHVYEIVTPCFGGYTVYIDAKLSPSGQREALDHAMWHVRNHDFEKYDVQAVERAAHDRERGKDK